MAQVASRHLVAGVAGFLGSVMSAGWGCRESMARREEIGNMPRYTAKRGLDIKLFGALFVLVGLIDVLIIEFFPSYALKLFGATITGPLAYPVKLHSPAVHFLICYGFLFLRPWAWGLAIAYGGFGIMSEGMNQLTLGYHPLRTGFMIATSLFLCYIAWRRTLFADPVPPTRRLTSSSPEVPL